MFRVWPSVSVIVSVLLAGCVQFPDKITEYRACSDTLGSPPARPRPPPEIPFTTDEFGTVLLEPEVWQALNAYRYERAAYTERLQLYVEACNRLEPRER